MGAPTVSTVSQVLLLPNTAERRGGSRLLPPASKPQVPQRCTHLAWARRPKYSYVLLQDTPAKHVKCEWTAYGGEGGSVCSEERARSARTGSERRVVARRSRTCDAGGSEGVRCRGLGVWPRKVSLPSRSRSVGRWSVGGRSRRRSVAITSSARENSRRAEHSRFSEALFQRQELASRAGGGAQQQYAQSFVCWWRAEVVTGEVEGGATQEQPSESCGFESSSRALSPPQPAWAAFIGCPSPSGPCYAVQPLTTCQNTANFGLASHASVAHPLSYCCTVARLHCVHGTIVFATHVLFSLESEPRACVSGRTSSAGAASGMGGRSFGG